MQETKPLSEMTLKEVKEMCTSRENYCCTNCIFSKEEIETCPLTNNFMFEPSDWELEKNGI